MKKDITFKKGVLSLNIDTDRDFAIYLCFNPSNGNAQEYIDLEKCLPKIKGLKRAKNRCSFAFDLVSNLHSINKKIITNQDNTYTTPPGAKIQCTQTDTEY